MIYSMTGYGRAELQDETKKISVEIKSVNHRYLDFNIRMPRQLYRLEAYVRNILKEYTMRGKVDVSIIYENLSESDQSLRFNQRLASGYVSFANEISETYHIPNDLTATSLMRFPEVLTQEAEFQDEAVLKNELEGILRSACVQFKSSREREGAMLCEDIHKKLEKMKSLIVRVEEREPEIIEAHRQRLTEKVTELLGESKVDENRIASEIVLYADRIATDEETVRLFGHIQAMEAELAQGGAVGRKLDFLAQEMNRESNTILSKANDLITSELGIGLKTDVEKIREQIQNIE